MSLFILQGFAFSFVLQQVITSARHLSMEPSRSDSQGERPEQVVAYYINKYLPKCGEGAAFRLGAIREGSL